jgi:rubrerythrin
MLNTKPDHNTTGGALSPENIQMMLQACKEFPPDVRGNESKLEAGRMSMVQEASSIGSIPIPMTIKGKVKQSFSKMLGSQPELFLDKLGERLAYERGGVRLYEAAIAKAHGLHEPRKVLKELEHIRGEEAEHMEMVKAAIEKVGGDPTAMTPCADLTSVAGFGLLQVVTDPRTNMVQTLDALLNAELIDNAAWELLIELAEAHHQKSVATSFQKALEQEENHLKIIKGFMKEYLNLK